MDIITYPQGAIVGELTGFSAPQGLCSDKSGHVYVVDGETGYVTEYAHGKGSPVKKLLTHLLPRGCAVDPISGDLAVTNTYVDSDALPNVLVYAHAQGTPRKYNVTGMSSAAFCSYDDKGNLFVDGAGNYYAGFALAELSRGGNKFTTVKLDKSVAAPGGVQWDGKYIAIGDFGAGTVYRMTGAGKVVDTITLDSGTYVGEFWIQGSTLVGANQEYTTRGAVAFWRYPTGGFPTKVFKKYYVPTGVTISVAR